MREPFSEPGRLSLRMESSSGGHAALMPPDEGLLVHRARMELQSIDSEEIIETVHARRAPMIPVSTSLRL
jgi:hypothetical protein